MALMPMLLGRSVDIVGKWSQQYPFDSANIIGGEQGSGGCNVQRSYIALFSYAQSIYALLESYLTR